MTTKLQDTFSLYIKMHDNELCLDSDGQDIKSDQNAYFNRFYDKVIKGTYLERKTTPFMIWRGFGYIGQLDELNFDSQTIENLNSQGLSIYLYELFLFSNKKNLVYKFPKKSDTLNSYLQLQSECLTYEFTSTDMNQFFSGELQSILNFAIRLNLTNITVHCCHYKIPETFISKYYPLKIITDNCCLPMLVNYINQLYENKDLEKNKTGLKKFICPLWRYSSARHLLAAYMISEFNIYLSWHYKGTFDLFKSNLWFPIENLKRSLYNRIVLGIERLNKSVPVLIDPVTDGSYVELTGNFDFLKHPPGYDGYYIENTLENYYKNSFCAIVAETLYAQPSSTFSEKTMIPMKCFTPFVIFGAPYTLEYIKSFGFKTFDRWWDESYDQEEDHEKRFMKICEVINFISSLSEDETITILKEMREILYHNSVLVSDVNTFDNIGNK